MKTLTLIESNKYDNFEKPIWGRDLTESKVRELESSMHKYGYLQSFPMTCSSKNGNGKRTVWEGNHRLEAAKRAGISVYFIEDENFTPEMTLMTNSTQNPWKIKDAAKYYSAMGNDEYTRLLWFHHGHPKISFTQCAWMLGTYPGTPSKQGWRKGFFDGAFIFTHEDKAAQLYSMLADFSQYENIDFAYHAKFVNSVFKLLKHKSYNHNRMVEKLKYLSRRVVRCPTVPEYLGMFTEIYNYNSRSGTDRPNFNK